MTGAGQDEERPLVLEDGAAPLVDGTHVRDTNGPGRATCQRMRPILLTGLMFMAIAALLITANESRPRANRSTVGSHLEVLGLSSAQTSTGVLAASLLGQTSSETRNAVMSHVNGRRSWGAQLTGLPAFAGTVFYPFGGVDAMSVVPLFPGARSIVIAALHKVGDCTRWSGSDLSDRIAMVASLMKGVFSQQGYFGTEEMYEHFDDTGIGVTPFLLASLSLIGETPIKVECGEGVGPQGASLGLATGNAVRILHRNVSTGAVHELIYAQVDLLTPSTELNSFLATMHLQTPLATMMKATGYILRRHEDNLVNRRMGARLDAGPILKVIVGDSSTILQDDTGVRISCLSDWQLYFYGMYIGPAFLANMTVDYRTDYDDSLRSAWCQRAQAGASSWAPKELPVRFGYPMFFQMGTCPTTYNTSCQGYSVAPEGKTGPTTPTMGFATYAVRR